MRQRQFTLAAVAESLLIKDENEELRTRVAVLETTEHATQAYHDLTRGCSAQEQ